MLPADTSCTDVCYACARYSKQYVEAQLAVALGGRVAEELVYGEMGTTVGASNDLQQVANMARRMVTEWGFSPKIGTKTVSNPHRRHGIPCVDGKWGEATVDVVNEEVSNRVVGGWVSCPDQKTIVVMLHCYRRLIDSLAMRT